MSNMQQLWELTKKFNVISGAANELSEKALIEQYTYIREEFREMADTFGDDDLGCARLSLEQQLLKPLLDDCLDVIITAFGMLQKLENLGVNVEAAAIATAMNNLSKYPVSPAIAHETVDKLLMKDGITAKAIFNEAENCYVIRDVATGKVKKPSNFIPNDLGQFITEEVKEKYGKSN